MKSPKRKKKKKSREEIEEKNRINANIRELSLQYRETMNELYLKQIFDLIKNKVYGIIYRRVYGAKKDPARVDAAYDDLLFRITNTIMLGKQKKSSKYPLEALKVDQLGYIYAIMNNTISDANKIKKRGERKDEIIGEGTPLGKGDKLLPNDKKRRKKSMDQYIEKSPSQEVTENEIDKSSVMKGVQEKEMTVDEYFKESENSFEAPQESEEDNNTEKQRLRTLAGEIHPLVKLAMGNKHNMNPRDLAIQEQTNQIIRKKYKEVLDKIIKFKDPRIKDIFNLKIFEELSFKEIARKLFPEMPPRKAESFVKGKYYFYEDRIEEFLGRDQYLRKLFDEIRGES